MAYGAYTPEQAEQVKNELDRHRGAIEHRIRRIKETVPGAPTPASRLDELADGMEEVIGDLREIIDERTDSEASA